MRTTLLSNTSRISTGDTCWTMPVIAARAGLARPSATCFFSPFRKETQQPTWIIQTYIKPLDDAVDGHGGDIIQWLLLIVARLCQILPIPTLRVRPLSSAPVDRIQQWQQICGGEVKNFMHLSFLFAFCPPFSHLNTRSWVAKLSLKVGESYSSVFQQSPIVSREVSSQCVSVKSRLFVLNY